MDVKTLSILPNSKVIIEDVVDDTLLMGKPILGRIKAILMELNTKSQNGTYYDDDWYNKVIVNNEKFQTKLKKKQILGEFDHPDKAGTSGKAVAFVVVEIWREDNIVWGKLEIFNTHVGRDLWVIIQAGVIIGFSLRGVGSDYYSDGLMKIEGDNFDLKGWDAVVDPSFISAEFKELTESEQDKVLDKLKINNNSNSVCRIILENINMIKEKENKDKSIIFENNQLKELDKIQKEKINTLLNTIDENKIVINEFKIDNDKLKRFILEKEDIIKQKEILINSKDKTNISIKEKVKSLENKILLLTEEIKEKNCFIDKNKLMIENLKNNKPADKIEVFLNKVEQKETNSLIYNSIINRLYEEK